MRKLAALDCRVLNEVVVHMEDTAGINVLVLPTSVFLFLNAVLFNITPDVHCK